MHHTNFIRNDDVSICACQNIFDCISRRNFAENETFRCDFKITSFSNDICASNGGRALKVLASAGLITLKAEAGANPTVADIDTYNVKIEIKEMGAADIPSVLPDVTAAVVNGNYALDYGIDPSTAIFEEKDYDDDSYFCLMAVRSSDADDAVYKRIVELFQSETTKQIFQDEFNGYFVPAWEVQK